MRYSLIYNNNRKYQPFHIHSSTNKHSKQAQYMRKHAVSSNPLKFRLLQIKYYDIAHLTLGCIDGMITPFEV